MSGTLATHEFFWEEGTVTDNFKIAGQVEFPTKEVLQEFSF